MGLIGRQEVRADNAPNVILPSPALIDRSRVLIDCNSALIDRSRVLIDCN